CLLVVWETASQMWRDTDFKARYKCSQREAARMVAHKTQGRQAR
ncbi:hypothetical protein, partial [Escherichia coli]